MHLNPQPIKLQNCINVKMSELLQLENGYDRPEFIIMGMGNALGKSMYDNSLKDNIINEIRTELFNEKSESFQKDVKNENIINELRTEIFNEKSERFQKDVEKDNIINELQKKVEKFEKKDLQKKKEEDEIEIEGLPFTHAGIHYLKDNDHIIYDKDTFDVIGEYNQRTNTIEEYTCAPITVREIRFLKEIKALNNNNELQKKNENDYASIKKSTREATLSRYSTQQFFGCSTVSIAIDENNQIDEYNNVPFLQETYRKMLKKSINDNDEIKNNEIECKEYLKRIFIITKIEYTEENITNFKRGTGYTYFEYGLSVRFNSGKTMIKILIRLIEFLELKMQLQIKLKTGEILDIVV